jgi:hypothetical protein
MSTWLNLTGNETGKQLLEEFEENYKNSKFYAIVNRVHDSGIKLIAGVCIFDIEYDNISTVMYYVSGNVMINFKKGGFIFIHKNKYKIEIEE